ncbi:MAG: 30S ribosomal protein S6 [Planctomycetota bacterium]
MKTVVNKKLYEAMFLVDSAEAAADWDGVNGAIKKILERAGAEIVSIRKWDECKLAYDINGKSRGTYILCYFRVEGERVHEIERDVQLSERIMRVLILCAEHMSQEDVEKDTPAVLVEKQTEKAAKATAKEDESEQVGDGKLEDKAESAAMDMPEAEQLLSDEGEGGNSKGLRDKTEERKK